MRLFFDTETSGLPNFKEPSNSPIQPFLVQIAWILEDDGGKEVGRFHSLVIPPAGRTIPDEATKLHGITTEMANKYGIKGATAAGLWSVLAQKADKVIGHNIDFDIRIMRIAMFQAGTMKPEAIDAVTDAVKAKASCTCKLATKIVNLPPTAKMIAAGFRKPKSPNLQECYKHFFGEEFEGAHGAMEDVIACRNVFQAISKEKAA